MFWLMSRAWQTLLGCLALVACSSLSSLKPPPDPVYDVQSAAVISGPEIPPALISATNERINAAIAATTRNAALPHVTLNVRITQIGIGQGFQHDRNTAKVTIDATSIDSGAVIAIASFETTTMSPDMASANDQMAEDIAARVRSTFALKTPQLGS
jgi:hypothetical protein